MILSNTHDEGYLEIVICFCRVMALQIAHHPSHEHVCLIHSFNIVIQSIHIIPQQWIPEQQPNNFANVYWNFL
jgi:hypothetical protein